MELSTLRNTLDRASVTVALLAAAFVLAGGANAASLSVNGTLTQNASSSSCTYTGMSETSSGNWTVSCGTGTKTITINPQLCGSFCSSYSGLVEDSSGNWTVNGCVSAINAGVALTQPSASVPNHPLGSALSLAATATACNGTITKVEFFASTTLIPGSAVTSPPYTFNWTPQNPGSYDVQARATDSVGGVTPSQTVNVYVNAPPSISTFNVTSPGTTASPPGPRAAPATFVLNATATDTNGINRIEFRYGATLIGSGSGASAQVTWSNAAAGTYSVFARAYDSLNFFTDSAPIALTVTASNQLPVNVQIATPAANSSLTAPVTLQATAVDNDGNIVRIEFIDNATGQVVASSTSGPNFTAPWTNPGTGSRTVYARAVDNSGGSSVSATLTFTVTEPFRLILSSAPASSPYYVAPANVKFAVGPMPPPPGQITQMTLYMDGISQGPFTAVGPLNEPQTWERTQGVPAGTHRFSALATTSNGLTGGSNDSFVTIDSSGSPPAANSCPAETLSGTVPGAMAGSASVGDSGSANYSIPIQAPPGIAGVAPSLGIAYSSQGGSGLLGVGWSLQGLSVIHRCPKTVFMDGQKSAVTDGANDPLCLDGQRLVPVSGSDRNGTIEYRTERESYSRIQSSNPFPAAAWAGPAYFKIWTKSGQILHYGYKVTEGGDQQDAVIRTYPFALPGKETGRVWGLYKIEDRVGNYILIDYATDNAAGTMRPSFIRYTGNSVAGAAPANRIDFTYEGRGADVAPAYDGGGQRSYETNRLRSIVTSADGQTVKRYTLSYGPSAFSGRSLLQSVQECSGDGQLCLSPTTFQWTDIEAGGHSFNFGGTNWQGTSTGADRDTTVAVDVNGDGKTDLVSRRDGVQTWDVCLSTGSAYACNNPTPWTSLPRAQGEGRDDVWHFADFNGDGKADVVFLTPGGGVTLQLSTGTGFGSSYPAAVNWNGARDNNGNPAIRSVGDFDGDGRVDLALYNGNYHWIFCSFNGSGFFCSPEVTIPGADQPYNSPNAQFDYLVGDFNGDGRADFAFHSNNSSKWRVCLSTSQLGQFSFDCYVNAQSNNLTDATPGDAYRVHVADMNGDGLADLLSPDFVDGAYPGRWKICLSKGDMTFDCSYWTGPNLSHENALLGDFNGDGRTDVLWWQGAGQGIPAGYRVCDSTGTGFSCGTTVWGGSIAPLDALKNVRAGDFNGDGKTDIAIWVSESSNTWSVGLAGGSPTDMVRRATNGLGAASNFTYKPLTDSSVYARESGALYPEIDIQSPMYVVSRVETTTMVQPPWFALDYSYRGLKGHTQGAGIAGFKGRIVVDPQAQLCSETETETVWNARVIGVPKFITKRYQSTAGIGTCSGGVQVSRVTNTWESRRSSTYTPFQNLSIFEVFLTAASETKSDLNGAATPSSSMSTPIGNIDAFGSPTYVSTSASDGYGKTTSNTYLNDSVNWIVGRVTQTTVTSSVPYAAVNNNPIRVSSFEYLNPSNGLLTSETVEPFRGGTSEYLRTSYTHDAFGNRETTTVSGLNVNRITKTVYCANGTAGPGCFYVDGRFLTYVQNAGGHEERRAYDRRFGTVSQLIDRNSLTSTSQVDKLGRKFCETRADGSTTGWTWGPGGDGGAYFATKSDSTGASTQQHFDGLNREVAVKAKAFDGSFPAISTVYDYRGRKSSMTKPSGGNAGASTYASTTFDYDDLNRIKSESGVLGYLATYLYNGMVSSVTVTGQSGAQTTQKTFNSRGEVVEVLDARSGRLQLQYDHFGNLEKKSVIVGIDGGSPTTTWIYFNTRGQKTGMNDPDQGSWSYGYNALGELTRQTDAMGQVSTFLYDNLGRMFQRNESELITNWTYDAIAGAACGVRSIGKLCRLDNTNATRDFQYDDKARLSSVKQSHFDGRGFQRFTTYDSMSRVRQLIYPVTGLTLLHSYNSNGYLFQIDEVATGYMHWKVVERFADGQMKTQQTRATTTNRTYDQLGRPATIVTPNVQNAAFAFDALGNLTSRSDPIVGLSESFTYDSLNRLTVVSGSSTRNYQYDSLGNLTYKSDLGTLTYVSGTHRLNTAAGVGYSHDPNGNFEYTMDLAKSVAYTPFGMPSSVTNYGVSSRRGYDYDYDGDHQRVIEWRMVDGSSNSKTYYFSDGIAPFFEEDHDFSDTGVRTVTWKHYVNTPEGVTELLVIKNDVAATRTDRLFARDHLGSTVVVFGDGAPEYLGYDAWGRRRNPNGTDNATATSTKTDRGFTGHEMMDDVGLVNMNGRIYNPILGRFLQPDPIIQAPGNLQSHNRYSYVLNSPLSLTDPTGFSWWNKFRDNVVKPVVVAFIAYWTGGAASSLFLESAAASAETAAIAAGAGGDIYSAASISATSMGGTGITYGTAAGAIGGASGGFAAGGIMGGNLQSAVYGAVSGGIGGGISGYFGPSYPVERVAANAIGGGISSSLTGGRFVDGFRSSLLNSSLTYANWQMRKYQIDLTLRDPEGKSDGTGWSRGMFGDLFKLGGGRFDPGWFGKCSPLGCDQRGPGKLFGFNYGYGGFIDMAVESFSGPHDHANMPWFYNEQGFIKELTTGQRFVGEWAGNYTSSLIFAIPFAAAGVREQSYLGLRAFGGR